MDRTVVYAGELPRLEDFMGFQKDVLYALGYIAEAMIGGNTAVAGLACAQTAPPSLQVTVGVGSIYAMETVDSTAYGALGTDVNTIVKQGLLESPTTLAISPPTTSGYSQVYLIEAAYDDVDTGTMVLEYYNSTNPQQPLSGPNNSGAQQNTVRSGQCAIALKAGAAAPTGTQVAPVPDAGYVGLYTITVSNGQSTVTTANIAVYPTAPFIPLTLPQVPPAIQQQAGNWAVDAGSANSLAITLPASTALTPGTPIRIKKANIANTGAMNVVITEGSTVLSPISIVWEDGSAFIAGDWPANAVGDGIYDGTVIRMSGPIGPTIWARASAINNTATIYNNLITNYPSMLPPRNYLVNQQSNGSGTATVPANVTQIYYEVGGAGGGGAGAGTENWAGGGGGSGGIAKGWMTVTPGDTISYVVGLGGAGAPPNGGNAVTGTAGTASSITHGATTISGTGGGGGTAGPLTCTGGAPGVGQNGQQNLYGAPGGDGNPYNSQVQGGPGGASAYGGGGRTSTAGHGNYPYIDAYAPCAGGGGVWNNAAQLQTGGYGADGSVILMY